MLARPKQVLLSAQAWLFTYEISYYDICLAIRSLCERRPAHSGQERCRQLSAWLVDNSGCIAIGE